MHLVFVAGIVVFKELTLELGLCLIKAHLTSLEKREVSLKRHINSPSWRVDSQGCCYKYFTSSLNNLHQDQNLGEIYEIKKSENGFIFKYSTYYCIYIILLSGSACHWWFMSSRTASFRTDNLKIHSPRYCLSNQKSNFSTPLLHVFN